MNGSLDFLREYFTQASSTNINEMLIQALIVIALSSLLSGVYYFTGNSLSNRSRLAAIFPLMALTTMLIITIIRSSLALSLGLVGALSIVRFRSAIKDPEELAYIFLTIALGLGFGASQPVVTTVFFFAIIAVLIAQAIFRGRLARLFTDKDSINLQLNFSKEQKLPEIIEILDKHNKAIRLTRMESGKKNQMMFIVKPNSTQAMDEMKESLKKMDSNMEFSVLQYQSLL